MENIQAWLSVVLSGTSAVSVLFLVYNHFRNPDIKSAARLDKIEAICPIKHDHQDNVIKEIKDSIVGLNKSVLLIKENDIKHIEIEMRRMSEVQTKILTILEYEKKKGR